LLLETIKEIQHHSGNWKKDSKSDAMKQNCAHVSVRIKGLKCVIARFDDYHSGRLADSEVFKDLSRSGIVQCYRYHDIGNVCFLNRPTYHFHDNRHRFPAHNCASLSEIPTASGEDFVQ
jgi:hypothetical protein